MAETWWVLVAPYPALQGAISVHPGHLQQAQKGLECGRFGLCKGVSVCVQCVCGAAPYLLVLAVLYLQGRGCISCGSTCFGWGPTSCNRICTCGCAGSLWIACQQLRADGSNCRLRAARAGSEQHAQAHGSSWGSEPQEMHTTNYD